MPFYLESSNLVRVGGVAGADGGEGLVGFGGDGAEPDVAVADGVAVVLEFEGAGVWEGVGVVGEGHVAGGADGLDVVLDEDAVEEDGEVGGGFDFAVFEDGFVEDDVVDLPLAGGAGGVNEGGKLAVERAGDAVGVAFVFVGVEDLAFVEAHEEDAGVTAALAAAFLGAVVLPFDVDLAVAVGVFGVDIAGAFTDGELAVFDGPFDGAVVFAEPLVGIFAVEEDDGVGGGGAGGVLGGGIAGFDFGGVGAGHVVDFVALLGILLGECRDGEGDGRDGGDEHGTHELVSFWNEMFAGHCSVGRVAGKAGDGFQYGT